MLILGHQQATVNNQITAPACSATYYIDLPLGVPYYINLPLLQRDRIKLTFPGFYFNLELSESYQIYMFLMLEQMS